MNGPLTRSSVFAQAAADRLGGVAIASWAAAVHCRFCALRPDRKAPEDWRSPKPGGPLVGSWKRRSFPAFPRNPTQSSAGARG